MRLSVGQGGKLELVKVNCMDSGDESQAKSSSSEVEENPMSRVGDRVVDGVSWQGGFNWRTWFVRRISISES